MVYMMTVVLRNGASIRMPTAIPRETPLFLRQDVTNNPLWTGKDAGLAAEDEHMSKFLKKYEGFDSATLSGGRSSSSPPADSAPTTDNADK